MDNQQWKAKVQISANSYEGMREAIASWSSQISEIKHFRDMWQANLCHSGAHEWNYVTDVSCPAEARIIELRAEADRLESELVGSKSVNPPPA